MPRLDMWVAASLTILLGLAGCAEEVPPELRDLPPSGSAALDPARLPRGPAADGELSLSRILVAWDGSHPPRRSRLSHAQAQRRAAILCALARAEGADFASLARRFSDDTQTSASGGELGVVSGWSLHPDVERAARSLALGQVSDPIETPEGFILLLRHAPNWAQAAEVVVSFEGAVRYTPRERRDRERARALAEEIRRRVLDGASIEEEALRFSDAPEFERGGIAPPFARGSRHPEFEAVVWALPPGGVSEVIETPTGFHLVRRLPIEYAQVRRIDVFFQQASEDLSSNHTRDEARALIEEALRRALAPGADFAALAVELSEGPDAGNGGRVEPFPRGSQPYSLERVAFRLAEGQVSGVLELPTGFTILKRIH